MRHVEASLPANAPNDDHGREPTHDMTLTYIYAYGSAESLVYYLVVPTQQNLDGYLGALQPSVRFIALYCVVIIHAYRTQTQKSLQILVIWISINKDPLA